MILEVAALDVRNPFPSVEHHAPVFGNHAPR
jgi:hypothetical protein